MMTRMARQALCVSVAGRRPANPLSTLPLSDNHKPPPLRARHGLSLGTPVAFQSYLHKRVLWGRTHFPAQVS